MVEDYRKDGLRAAGILDCLRGEEDVVLCSCLIIGAVDRGLGSGTSCFTSPFEKENNAVDGTR